MSDLFHENVKDEWIDKAFAVMALCPQHTFQILTKRPERMRDYFQSDYKNRVYDWMGWYDAMLGVFSPENVVILRDSDALPQVWLGVSVENQKTADERIPLLLDTPAAIRFLSCEPLLEQINITNYLTTRFESSGTHHEREKIDWVIVGGESGAGARICNIRWISWLVHQCKMWNVACFVKQLGSLPYYETGIFIGAINLKDRKGGDISEFPKDLQIREFPNLGNF